MIFNETQSVNINVTHCYILTDTRCIYKMDTTCVVKIVRLYQFTSDTQRVSVCYTKNVHLFVCVKLQHTVFNEL